MYTHIISHKRTTYRPAATIGSSNIGRDKACFVYSMQQEKWTSDYKNELGMLRDTKTLSRLTDTFVCTWPMSDVR